MNSTEAIYAFVGWVQATGVNIHKCAYAVDMIDAFAKHNKLPEPREDFFREYHKHGTVPPLPPERT